ncbi:MULTISPECIES: winged helix-turn-helix domain-containing protein [Lelliottia]|jgi:DNA-binding winged helix-turn-helix (wHTH) protein|uniref:Winged helix-turn-helix domain-containing protein n=1 Tax=Lelliottia wanjuensis TaxID=3050585 RepID=A0AAP4D7U2_9ENTR|nr:MULTISPECIES: winged helix-turn-helix domain-containing protein [unclassified Lelliottia]MDI3361337.1 winged helix-turn-helix domain-containing protein [Lelliottia sp. V89_13]MDK9358582.1 winged helix-turn-helix domain-containing protein [Lelliottia sp. V106_16]MDK9365042.1 winged helix-turn-helix domain-containing protein [Lelliottia sp. V106_12]MDK9376142.1 winged helix-turn-helix domain-containing protein [Lelliottia sp. V106_10]MDK9549922.1 winged helix-turn-helix domain-containing prot
MGYRLYGFMIGEEIHFDISNRRLYRLTGSHTDKSVAFASIYFNETMLRLFLYLLEHGRKKVIAKEELFEKIWEDNNLSPSTQRLWQVLHNLNNKLNLLGLPDDFIRNIRGHGYIINYQDVVPVYYRMSELPAHSDKKKEKSDPLNE